MSLNIKNDEAHRLAKELARLTGESMTEAVTTSLKQRLESLKKDAPEELAAKILNLSVDCQDRWKEPWASSQHEDLLYDELGLPK